MQTLHLRSVNARWFTPLLLLCFALFVLGAKAYISRTPAEPIQAPVIEPPQRIYAMFPAAARRDEANSRVFKPRPRSLEPLPIMAMARPIIEPTRPDNRNPAAADALPAIPRVGAGSTAVALATPPAVQPDSPPSEKSDLTTPSQPDEPPTSASTEDAATAVAAADPDATDPDQSAPESDQASEPYPSNTASSEVTASSTDKSDKPSNGPALTWQEAVAAAAEQIDNAAVRLRSNYENGPAAQLTRAFEALESGRFERANQDFDAVVTRNPNLAQAWSGKGEALVGLNRFEEAANAYSRVIALPDAALTARYNYGVVLYRLSRYVEAAEQFRAVAAQKPDHAEAHYNLATLAQRDGRLAEAMEAWKVFTRLQPTVAGGWFNLGIVYMDYDRPGEAVACFKRVIELDQNDADAHINLAMAFMASDRPSEALTALETAETRLPGDRVVLRYLADVHSQLAELGGPDAAMHRDKAATCRSRIAAAPTREQRKAVAGTPGDPQP